MTRCTFDPRPLLGQPLGMFHCDGCDGCVVVAGLPHGPCEPWCRWQDDADRTLIKEMDAQLAGLEAEEVGRDEGQRTED
jgi:hypothetical protein